MANRLLRSKKNHQGTQLEQLKMAFDDGTIAIRMPSTDGPPPIVEIQNYYLPLYNLAVTLVIDVLSTSANNTLHDARVILNPPIGELKNDGRVRREAMDPAYMRGNYTIVGAVRIELEFSLVNGDRFNVLKPSK